MPRIPVIFAALLVFATVAGVGGYFLLRPPEPKRTPQPEQPPGGDPKPSPNPPEAPQSKLVVLVVFDQMRGDYMSRWAELYGADGFERIKKNGIWFSNWVRLFTSLVFTSLFCFA